MEAFNVRRRNAVNAASASLVCAPYRVGARDVNKVGPARKGYPAWKLRGESEVLVVIPEDKELSLLTGKAYYDEWERVEVLKAQYESACNGGKRSRKPRSLHNAQQRMFEAPKVKATAKATAKATVKATVKGKRKRSAPSPMELEQDHSAPKLKSALVQPGAKRRKGAKAVRFVDARDLTSVCGFSIMAAAEAMCGLVL